MCAGVGLAAGVIAGVAGALGGGWQFPAGAAALMTVIAAYFFRVANGWVCIDPAGLRTSRWVRGRRFRWDEIDSLEPKTWYGRGGTITVVRVRTRSGWSYYLPAPRSTRGEAEPAFRRQLSQLQHHVMRR